MALWSEGRVSAVRQWRTVATPTLAEAVARYLADVDSNPASACFAVAGPTDGEKAILTNVDWSGSVGWLGFPALLVNDLHACAVGVGGLTSTDSVSLIDAPKAAGPAAVVGVGTGMGQAVLLEDGQVLAGEGGHADFAPADAEQLLFRQWMADRVQRVTVDEVLSGRGLASMLRFVAMQEGDLEALTRLGPDFSKAVTERGDSDPICSRARDLFLGCLGAETVNFALRVLPRSGIYLCGGVIDHLGDAMARPAFRDMWNRPGGIGALLKTFPCRRVTRPHLAMLGAGLLAKGLCEPS